MAKAAIMAAFILFVLVLGFSALVWFGFFPFSIKDGQIIIPDPEKVFLDNTSETAEIPSDEMTFRGTFNWEVLDGSRRTDSGTFYLWVHQTDTGTQASFKFGEHFIDGWPVFLVSENNGHYVFESSKNSFVERVRVTFDVNGSETSGTVVNITDISSFVKGDFKGTTVPHEEYVRDVID